MLQVAASFHSFSENGIASTRRQKFANGSGSCSTRQKFESSPLMSLTTSETPRSWEAFPHQRPESPGFLASRTAPPNREKMTEEDPVTTLAAVAALVIASVAAFFAYRQAGLLWAGVGFVVLFIGILLFGASLSSVDDRFRYRVRSSGEARPVVRRAAGGHELLVPLRFAARSAGGQNVKEAEVDVELTW